VRRAVDSVLQQDTPALEVIVVDDGSTDDTAPVLASYGDAIRVLRQENQGVSAARNHGVAASGGALIAFLDSDDRWLPGKLSRQAAYMIAHPEVQICQTEEIWIRDGVRVNPRRRHSKPSGWIFEPSLALCLVSPSAVMMTRALWDEMGGFDTSLPACEDYDLWLRVSLRYPVDLLPDALIEKYGGHSDQLSRMPALDRYRIQAICKVIDSGALSAGQHAAAVAMLHTNCAIFAAGCRKRGRLEEAERIAALPHRYGPV
jgi:glycosyltransferase involved in cell wall biosynthesis